MQARPRWWAWVCGLLWGCGGEYPLAPTPCDDWCLAVQRGQCRLDFPHSCVVACERAGGRPAAPCDGVFDAFIDCFTATPSGEYTCVGGKTYAEASVCLDIAVIWLSRGCGPVPPEFPTVVGGRSRAGADQ